MTCDISKFDKFEEIDDGEIFNLGIDVSCLMNDKIRCDDAYWV